MKRSLACLILALMLLSPAVKAELVHDKAYEHIMKTKTIRCGYSDWAPWLVTDPNTKEVSGIMKNVMGEIGKRMGVKIEWTENMGWGEITTAANSGRIDMFCNTLWPDKAQLQNMSLSRPVYYTPTYAYARADDNRFDNNMDKINDPDIIIVGIDGDSSYLVMEDNFPKAKMLALPNTNGVADQFMSVITKKGDLTMADEAVFADFNKKNPGKLKQVQGKPLFIMSEVLVTRAGEQQLMNVINTILYGLVNEGFVAKQMKEYGVTTSFAPKPDFDMPAMYKGK